MAAGAYRRNPANNTANQRYLAEEFLANCADAKVKPSWRKELIAKIRAWLRDRFPSLQFTQKDIEGVLSMAARRVRKNSVVKENLTTDRDIRFLAEEKGVAVRALYEGDKVIPIAEGFNFDKTSDMQQAMQDYISLLDGSTLRQRYLCGVK